MKTHVKPFIHHWVIYYLITCQINNNCRNILNIRSEPCCLQSNRNYSYQPVPC